MESKMCELIIGALLHDVGKVIYRTGETKEHSGLGYEYIKKILGANQVPDGILDSIRYHHKKKLKSSKIQDDSVAYITYIADNIAAGADRREREIEGDETSKARFQRDIPLSPVFNLLKNGTEKFTYASYFVDGKINYPTNEKKKLIPKFYEEVLDNIKNSLASIKLSKEYINSLLEVLDVNLSYVPSSTNTEEVTDISLYDHSKVTAMVGSCILEYLEEKEINDFKQELLKNEADFYDKKAFILFSFDFSGIQNFIYNIKSENALKNLRARSFYLEIVQEHLIDELLTELGLSRVNLMYTGGGHCYILLPNTIKAKETIKQFNITVNKWLMKEYGTGLYLANAYSECSANDLMNNPANESPYKKIYQTLGERLSKVKMNRYTAEDIIKLNKYETKERECAQCGKTHDLGDDDLCISCEKLINLSSKIIEKEILILSTNKPIEGQNSFEVIAMDGLAYLSFIKEKKALEILQERPNIIKQIYTKNKSYTGLNVATKIWVGDYTPHGTLEDYAIKSKGIKRLAVLRADIDDLGKAFVSGFEREKSSIEEQNRYTTIARTATLSRQLSMFFKYNINELMSGNTGILNFELANSKTEKPNVAIIYSGGDDVFLIGAWNEVIEAANNLQLALSKFTNNKLTISAGIGIYGSKYPISKMALDTAELEEASKEGTKNQITIFSKATTDNKEKTIVGTDNTYNWEIFRTKVVGEKLTLLKDFFGNENTDRGKSFLYKLLDYLRECENDKINIARYAYMLARLEPKKLSPAYESYNNFSKLMYQWMNNNEDRKQLITAIYIYAYLVRESKGE